MSTTHSDNQPHLRATSVRSRTSAAAVSSSVLVQVRSQVIAQLPAEYKCVYLEVEAADCPVVLTSNKVSVKDGFALLDFWARLPTRGSRINIKLIPTSPAGRAGFIRYRVRAHPLYAMLHFNLDEADVEAGHSGMLASDDVRHWKAVTLSLTPRGLLDRLAGRVPTTVSAAIGRVSRVFSAAHQQQQGSVIAAGGLALPAPGPVPPHNPLEDGAVLQLQYMVLHASSGPDAEHLPELDLVVPLARRMHSYAHGGFMGAALSMVCDGPWRTLLLNREGEEKGGKRAAEMQSFIDSLTGLGSSSASRLGMAKKQALPLMGILENSPVLCAYGLVRSGCTVPQRPDPAPGDADEDELLPLGKLASMYCLEPERLPYMVREPAVNRYGYAPMALEWDIWLNPSNPGDLAGANVDHGSPAHLVQQAVAMALACHSMAKTLGERHNLEHGMSPQRWLTEFGTSLNEALFHDPTMPLPLYHPAAPGHSLHGLDRSQQAGVLEHAPAGPALQLAEMPVLEFDPAPRAVQSAAAVAHVGGSPAHTSPGKPGGGASTGVRGHSTGVHHHLHYPQHHKPPHQPHTISEDREGVARGFGDVPVPVPPGLERYDNGNQCPSIQRYIQLGVTALDLGALSDELKQLADSGKLLCRLRLSGNAQSPNALQLLGFTAAARDGGNSRATSGRQQSAGKGRAVSGRPQSGASAAAEAYELYTWQPGAGAPSGGAADIGKGGDAGIPAGAGMDGQLGLGLANSLYPLDPDMSHSSLWLELMHFRSRKVLAKARISLGAAMLHHAEGRASVHMMLMRGKAAAYVPDRHGKPEDPAPADSPVTVNATASKRATTHAATPSPPMAQQMERPNNDNELGWRPVAGCGRPGPVAEASEQEADVEAAGTRRTPRTGASGVPARGWGAVRSAVAHHHALAPQPTRAAEPAVQSGGTAAPPQNPNPPQQPLQRMVNLVQLVRLQAKAEQGSSEQSVGAQDLSGDEDAEVTGEGEEEESEEEEEVEEEGEAGPGGKDATEQWVNEQDIDLVPLASQLASMQASSIGGLAGPAVGAARISLAWRTLTVLEAAEQLHGLPRHVAQSCIAMLAKPGGLYLDVKSGYSTAKQLRKFASTLAGVGIHVKAICSFVPKQIDFDGTFAALLKDPTKKRPKIVPDAAVPNAEKEQLELFDALPPEQTITAARQQPQPVAEASGDGPLQADAAAAAAQQPSDTAAGGTGRPHTPPPVDIGEAGTSSDGGDEDSPQNPLASFAEHIAERVTSAVGVAADTVTSAATTAAAVVAAPHALGRGMPPPQAAAVTAAAVPAPPPPAAPAKPAAPHAAPARSFDAVLFFHGLNGLELACEAGRVPPGTCVLFNGASLLLEDPGEALKRLAVIEGVRRSATSGLAGNGAPGATTTVVKDTKAVKGKVAAIAAAAGGALIDPEATQEALRELTGGLPALVDPEAWRRYCVVQEVFHVLGGIYVQEPDCCPAAVDALVRLVNEHPLRLPLGFAYGHLSAKAVAVSGMHGRGLAAQQLLEELSARKELSGKVRSWIIRGVHLHASDEVYICWGRRLLCAPGLLTRNSQLLLLQLLADYRNSGGVGSTAAASAHGPAAGCGAGDVEGARLLFVVKGMGGIKLFIQRFVHHFEQISPLTLFELGFNINHTKPLLRLLRNRGALSALGVNEKADLARWLVTEHALRGWLWRCGRGDVHKLVKEALTCLVESCRAEELAPVFDAVGGERRLRRLLQGWLRLAGWSYLRRVRAAQRHLAEHPDTPAYSVTRYGYVRYRRRYIPPDADMGRSYFARKVERLGGYRVAADTWWCCLPRWAFLEEDEDGVLVSEDVRRSRRKHWVWRVWRLLSKALLCVATWIMHLYLACFTCCISPLCVFPMCCGPYCRNKLLPFLVAIFIMFIFWSAYITVGVGAGVTLTSGTGPHNNGTLGNSTSWPPPAP